MNETTLGSFLLPEGFRRPPVVALLKEGRIVREAGSYTLSRAAERRSSGAYAAPRPERHGDPVLLVPGFLAGDYTLTALARRLRREGLRTYRSSIRLANVGCTYDAAALVEARLEAIVAKRERKVQLVGHSLGGMLARGIAVRRPDLVSGITTMGSPMLAPGAHHLGLTLGVGALVALSKAGVPGVMNETCVAGECARDSFEESREPLPEGISFTAIYSRNDGIVDWRSCVDPIATPVEVHASHVGMAVDPAVADRVVEALARHRAAAQEAGGLLSVTA